MFFLVTIDTEEDQWSDYSTAGQTLENIKAIPRLQTLFEKYNTRPTYLISRPVAQDPYAVEILGDIEKEGKAEIGAHCHPWNTPPFTETINPYNSMLCNLPSSLQYEKLLSLTCAIQNNFKIQPVSFRSGRWGYNSSVADSLARLGYLVDSSLTPFMDWSAYNGPDLSDSPLCPFFFNPPRIMTSVSDGSVFEIPVSIGFSRTNFKMSHNVFAFFEKTRLTKKYFIGSLVRLGILKKIWLSPEISTSKEMTLLISILKRKGAKHLNLMFHSNSLKPGNTPFVKNSDDINRFFMRLEKVLHYIDSLGCQPVTLSELSNIYRNQKKQCLN